MHFSNHRTGRGRKNVVIHILIWLVAKDEENLLRFFFLISKPYSTVNFVFSLSLSVIDALRLVILIWCLVMCSYIHIFLCRQSLRKKIYSPARDIICTHQIMVVSSTYIWAYEVLSCVKLNETIRSFLSYSITLNIHTYIYYIYIFVSTSHACSIIIDYISLLVKTLVYISNIKSPCFFSNNGIHSAFFCRRARRYSKESIY
jgi:hypothetical protein